MANDTKDSKDNKNKKPDLKKPKFSPYWIYGSIFVIFISSFVTAIRPERTNCMIPKTLNSLYNSSISFLRPDFSSTKNFLLTVTMRALLSLIIF